jgi:predicted nucleotide-binding protein (sugar kinase/HSP70/actin superfamily)
MMPLINYIYHPFHTKKQLYQMLKRTLHMNMSFFEVSAAYDKAREFKKRCKQESRTLYHVNRPRDDIHVILLGRPYTVLSEHMNKGIPDIFASFGYRTFYQDMLTYGENELRPIRTLLEEFHWSYASNILEAAEVTARRVGAYPVLITSFKCSPDAFVSEYFKQIMEAHQKPYLILQLDEHDSSVGYETRIEAALRSFKNHYDENKKSKPVDYPPSLKPERIKDLSGKTLIIPNWDSISLKLVTACLEKEGIDARLMGQQKESTIQKSLSHNNGQCIPINIMAQAFMDTIDDYGLDPKNTALWVGESSIACNIKLIPHYIKTILNRFGKGMEKAGVYAGSLSFIDVSVRLPQNVYFAYMIGGMIRKLGCRFRPYEKVKGQTDRTISQSVHLMADAFRGNRDKQTALEKVVALFRSIERYNVADVGQRPKVAIFGDLYVRDNRVMNQNLIRFIEDNGGEVVTTPYSDYVKMIVKPYLRKWFREGHYFDALFSKAIMTSVRPTEKVYQRILRQVLDEPEHEYNESPAKILDGFNLRIEHTGESMESLLKIYYLKKYYTDLSLFVQLIPAFCCPSLVTEGMAQKIEEKTGIPMVSITYDGTGGNKNEAVIPYLKFPRRSDPGKAASIKRTG